MKAENINDAFFKPISCNFADSDRDLSVWDEDSEGALPMKVVCSMKSLQPPTPLPITAKDRDPHAERAFAAQYFNIPATSTNIPTWIAGFNCTIYPLGLGAFYDLTSIYFFLNRLY